MSLNLYGIYVIYAQFVRVHLYGDQNPYPGAMMDPSSIEDMESVVLLQKTVVLLSTRGRVAFWHFIIAFSYLIFTTTAVINVELKEQLKALSLTPPKIQEFATVTKTLFVIGQTCITVCYAIPLFYSYIVLNYMSPGFMDNGTSFFYLCIIAASLGFLGSFLESKKPFPQIKGRPPLFPFEVSWPPKDLQLLSQRVSTKFHFIFNSFSAMSKQEFYCSNMDSCLPSIFPSSSIVPSAHHLDLPNQILVNLHPKLIPTCFSSPFYFLS